MPTSATDSAILPTAATRTDTSSVATDLFFPLLPLPTLYTPIELPPRAKDPFFPFFPLATPLPAQPQALSFPTGSPHRPHNASVMVRMGEIWYLYPVESVLHVDTY